MDDFITRCFFEESKPISVPPFGKSPAQGMPPSLVRVRFPGIRREYTYYNERFELRRGDFVYVDGALAGVRGEVVEVCRSFKIKRGDYRCVIERVDTAFRGRLYFAPDFVFTLDPSVLPRERLHAWFFPTAEEGWLSGSEQGESLRLASFESAIGEPALSRGKEYYAEHRVVYLSLQGEDGYAIVEGGKHYEVWFSYRAGVIERLTCDCPVLGHCKHEAAALFALRALLDAVTETHGEEFSMRGCLAAAEKSVFYQLALSTRTEGSLIIS